MKILFLPKYSFSGPSSRYRTHQFIPFFEKIGIECDLIPFFSDSHIEKINSGKRSASISSIINIIKRFKVIFIAKKYDLLFIEKELIPYFPGIIEWILHLLKINYILDYDDAVFHNYDKNGKKIFRLFLSRKIPLIIKRSTAVIAGSRYLLRYAEKFNRNVILIPTVIDISKYPKKESNKTDDFIIGWVGSYYTSRYVVDILEVLDKFTEKYNAKVHLLGFNKKLLEGYSSDKIIAIDWNKNTEVEEILKFSVGISPLHDTAFARGKCAFKSVQYMACGIPVITTPIEANGETVINGVNGFHAYSAKDWFNHLEYFYLNRDKLIEFGHRNRELVEKQYTIQSRLSEYERLFHRLSK